jgi:hypothetical protein
MDEKVVNFSIQEPKSNKIVKYKKMIDYCLIINLTFGYSHEIIGEYQELHRQYMKLIKLMAENADDYVNLNYSGYYISFYISNIISLELCKIEDKGQ